MHLCIDSIIHVISGYACIDCFCLLICGPGFMLCISGNFFFFNTCRCQILFFYFLRGNPLNILETCCFQPSYLETM